MVVKILNLYAGLGGNRHLWPVEVEVTAIESDQDIVNAYRDAYPQDKVVRADAMTYLLKHFEEFDAIWASPPCQSHSRMLRSGRNRKPRYVDMSLWQLILFCEQHVGDTPWLVENVRPSYKPFLPPQGSSGRHLFWSNRPLWNLPEIPSPPNLFNRQNLKAKAEIEEWLGIGPTPTIYIGDSHDHTQILRNCVHPKLSLAVLEELLK